MAEYITKEAAIQTFEWGEADVIEDYGDGCNFGFSRGVIKSAINAIPAADVVPVVRCKDCKHYRNYPNGLCYLHTEPKTNARGYSGEAVCVEPDDFCSYGERKEGAE